MRTYFGRLLPLLLSMFFRPRRQIGEGTINQRKGRLRLLGGQPSNFVPGEEMAAIPAANGQSNHEPLDRLRISGRRS